MFNKDAGVGNPGASEKRIKNIQEFGIAAGLKGGVFGQAIGAFSSVHLAN
jgi:hypothetical protein